MRGDNDQHIRDVLSKVFGGTIAREKMTEAALRAKWPDIMGPTVKRYTRDIRLRGDTLVLEVESATLREELRFAEKKLVARVNEELGEEVVRRVRFR